MAKITGIELTEQEARDILTTAIEGRGIQYWASEHDKITIWRDQKTLDIKRAIIKVENQHGQVETYNITTDKIKRAASKIVSENLSITVIKSLVEEDVDAGDADYIIQVACFGEVIYG